MYSSEECVPNDIPLQHLLENSSVAGLPHWKTRIKERQYFEDSKEGQDWDLASILTRKWPCNKNI